MRSHLFKLNCVCLFWLWAIGAFFLGFDLAWALSCLCRLSWLMDWRTTPMRSPSSDYLTWSGCCTSSSMTRSWTPCSLGSWWRPHCAPATTESLSPCRHSTCCLCPWLHPDLFLAWSCWRTASLPSVTLSILSALPQGQWTLPGVQIMFSRTRLAVVLLLVEHWRLRWHPELAAAQGLLLSRQRLHCSLLLVACHPLSLPLLGIQSLSMTVVSVTMCSKRPRLSEMVVACQERHRMMLSEGVCWGSSQNASSFSWCVFSTVYNKAAQRNCVHQWAWGWRDLISRHWCMTQWHSVRTLQPHQGWMALRCMICMVCAFILVLTARIMATTSAIPWLPMGGGIALTMRQSLRWTWNMSWQRRKFARMPTYCSINGQLAEKVQLGWQSCRSDLADQHWLCYLSIFIAVPALYASDTCSRGHDTVADSVRSRHQPSKGYDVMLLINTTDFV